MNGAIEIVRGYFSKIRGEEEVTKALALPNANLIEFDVIDAMEKEDVYIIKCEVKEGVFLPKKHRYTVKIDAKGEINEVKRESG